LLRMDRVHIHSSGHANREDLLRIIGEIRPKAVIPIHTESPRGFKKLIKGEGSKVIIPEEAARIELRF